MNENCYKLTLKNCNSENDIFTFSFTTHDDLKIIIEKIQEKDNLSSEIATQLGIGLKIFSDVVRKNKDKKPFSDIIPHLNDIMKIVKGKNQNI